jgi:hypothetical protein
MVFKAAFNNIAVISWPSVLLVEETRVPGETTDLSQVTDNFVTDLSQVTDNFVT